MSRVHEVAQLDRTALVARCQQLAQSGDYALRSACGGWSRDRLISAIVAMEKGEDPMERRRGTAGPVMSQVLRSLGLRAPEHYRLRSQGGSTHVIPADEAAASTIAQHADYIETACRGLGANVGVRVRPGKDGQHVFMSGI